MGRDKSYLFVTAPSIKEDQHYPSNHANLCEVNPVSTEFLYFCILTVFISAMSIKGD